VKDIPFLMGDNDKGWMADLDFILRQDKVTKIMEGSYKSSKNKKDMNANKFDNNYKDNEEKINYTCPNHKEINVVGRKSLYTYCPKCRTKLIVKDLLVYSDTVAKAVRT
tara:strand:- start:262 stop:588 length:327 start_codon:yes stop_codon:yes gene_type:complete